MELRLSSLLGKGYGAGLFTNPRLSPCRYRLFYGARNTKKSENMLGREPLFKLMSNPIRNIMFVRKNDSDNGQSTFANLVAIIDKLGLATYFKCATNPRKEIIYRPTGQKIIFRGFNNPEGMASIKFEKGMLTDIYIEEASEIDNYDDFRVLDGSLRGVTPQGVQLQITIAMNPWNQNHWIYERFVKGRQEDDVDYLMTHDYKECYDPDFTLGYGKGLYLHQSTYKVNEFRDPSYDENMESLRVAVPEEYKVVGLGCWGNAGETTYPEFTSDLIVEHSKVVPDPNFPELGGDWHFDGYAIGIDTGLSNGEGKRRADGKVRSATTMQLVGITDDYSKIVFLDEYYYSNDGQLHPKTQPQFVQELIQTIIKWRDYDYRNAWGVMKGTIPVYIDNADIGFRQSLALEAERQGLYNAEFIPSTKLPIQARVDFIRCLMGYKECLVTDRCPNLIQEMKSARHGENGEVRQNINDHAINANEYAWATLSPRMRRWRDFGDYGYKIGKEE